MENMPDKLEPGINLKFVFDNVAAYVQKQGDESMGQIIKKNDSNPDNWLVRQQLDVVLKMLLNGLGECQRAIMKQEEDINRHEKEILRLHEIIGEIENG